MNLLRRLRLGHGGLSLLGCRSSIGQRSLASCVVPAAGCAKKDPRWAMLNYGIARMNDAAVADAKTMAESRTSSGRHLRVSLGLAPPPASSFFYYDWPAAGDEDSAATHGCVVAAHGDSALLNVTHREEPDAERDDDYFVCTAASAGRPPSLSLLPDPPSWWMSRRNTGILRRGEDELLVAKLDLNGYRPGDTVDMSVHRVGSHKWEWKSADIVPDDDEKEVPHEGLESYMAVPVGDRFMCWVDHCNGGLVVCDMAAAENPKLRYVQLPVIPEDDFGHYYDGAGDDDRHSWDMCAAAGGRVASVRFVSIDPRCCCGHSPSRSACPNSHELFAR